MAAAFSGCATVPEKITKTEALANLERHSVLRSAVSGTLLVTTELEGHTVTAPGVLLAEWPDRIRLEVQDPVGGVLALLVVNGDQFWLYDSNRADILTGPLRKLPAGMVPQLSASELVRVFLARPDTARFKSGKVQVGSAELVDNSGKESVTWSGEAYGPDLWKLSRTGRAAAAASYEDYTFRDGVHYPTKIRLAGSGPDGKARELLLAWKDWQPSVPKEKKLFLIPQESTFGRKIKALR